jgi:2-phosphosulfolactate phosphatase
MAAALSAGVAEIRIFESLASAQYAGGGHRGPKLLCGEKQCVRPVGFDLGNSPGDFTAAHAGKTLFMATTNGTRAILAAQRARELFIGALVNASATAQRLAAAGLDTVLLCAGTDGAVAMEDMLGAGAVLAALRGLVEVQLRSDVARMALRLFETCRAELPTALRQCQGGRNVIRAGLEADIDFAARLDAIPVIGVVRGDPLRVARG